MKKNKTYHGPTWSGWGKNGANRRSLKTTNPDKVQSKIMWLLLGVHVGFLGVDLMFPGVLTPFSCAVLGTITMLVGFYLMVRRFYRRRQLRVCSAAESRAQVIDFYGRSSSESH